MAQAIMVLREQHAEVNALFMKIERTGDPVLRAHIFRTIDAGLRIHSRIEEELFYPAFREHAANQGQRSEVSENIGEHDRVKRALHDLELTDPAGGEFWNRLQFLKSLVQHHVLEEEGRMFREAYRIFTPRELDDLGYRMEQAAMFASPVYEMAGPRV
jgi:hypothetical protein